MKRLFCIALVLISAAGAFAQTGSQPFDLSGYGVRVEPDRRLIVVLASLEAAGFELPLTEKGDDFRRRLRSDFESLSPDLKTRMRIFIDQYAKRILNRRRVQMVADQRSAAELQKFDETTKSFFERLEKYRADQMSDAEKSNFRSNNRDLMSLIASPFVSMAYTLGPVPDLNEPSRSVDLPGDLLEVLDFSPYVRQFYRATIRVKDNGADRSTTVGARIEEYYKEYQANGDALRPSAVRMVRDLLDYLHTRPQTTYVEKVKTEIKTGKNGKQTLSRIEDRERERRFYIVPDMLAPSGTVNFRNIGDDYFVIVAPGTDLSESEVRRAFLQFILDPIILRNAKDILTFKDGIKTLLDERRKTNPGISPDIFLAVSRSLVAAADARQTFFNTYQEATFEARRAVAAGRKPISETTDAQGGKVVKLSDDLFLIDGRFVMPAAEDEMNLKLAEAYENGAVLAFYFAQAMKGLEDSQFDITSSLRDIILSLDTTKESTRLAETADARTRAAAKREEIRRSAATIVENPFTKKLTAVEALIQAQNYSGAETELNQLAAENPAEPRVYYALGRVKSLSAATITDPEKRNPLLSEAQKNFTKVLTSATEKTDLALISLTYVALARLYEYFDQNAYAVKIYEKAISLGDMKGGGYQEAVVARERLVKEQEKP